MSEKKTKRRAKSISDNIVSVKDVENTEQALTVNSPRTLEACQREGVDPEELTYRPFNEFASSVLPNELAQMRFDYYENKRQEVIKIIKKTRRKVMKEMNYGQDDLNKSSPSNKLFIFTYHYRQIYTNSA